MAAEEHVQKIRAAVRVKNEMKAESFMITARTDAREIVRQPLRLGAAPFLGA